MDQPCPTQGCGSLARKVSGADEGEARDAATHLEQLLQAHPRSWRDQWDRVNRWYERFQRTLEGRPHTDKSPVYEDEMYAFFESCFQLKDWLKNDPSHPVDGQRVEDFVAGDDAMRWCADLANGSKHLIADRFPRVDPKLGLARTKYDLTLGNSTEPTLSATYVIVGAGQERDAGTLATDCVAAWRDFLTREGLLPIGK